MEATQTPLALPPLYQRIYGFLSPTLSLVVLPSKRSPLQMSNARGRTRLRAAAQNSPTRNTLPVQEYIESFLRERQTSGDFISKASDMLWKEQFSEADEEWHDGHGIEERLAEMQRIKEKQRSEGFLKFSQVKNWDLGIAPMNAIFSTLETEREQEDQTRAGFLEYAALKQELLLVTTGIAVGSSLYCLLAFSPKIALSYGIGAVGSILYLQLLYGHVDKVSRTNIPKVFLERRPKRIGIEIGDVQEFFQRAFYGGSLALSSTRLLIPVMLFGVWFVCHKSGNEFFDLKLAALMLGFFAYKAATWFQVYRENRE